MEAIIKKQYLLLGVLIFVGLPVLLFVLGETSHRTMLKNSISLLTVIALFIMIAQLFLSRANATVSKIFAFKSVLKLHKLFGYFFVAVFILHPFFIVLPRFFEAGILPGDAFWKLITTFNTTGQIVGLVAYIMMFVLGVTSIFRQKLGIKYKTWRVFHGILSLLFVVFAIWHAIDMGRHTDDAMSIWMIAVGSVGFVLVLNIYISKERSGHER